MPFVNRFSTVKTLEQLLETITTKNVTFRNLSGEEVERINAVLAANIPDMGIVITDTISFDKAIAITSHVVNNKNIKEDKSMNNNEVKTNINLAVEELFEKFEKAKETVKVKSGQTYEEYVKETDNALNIAKGALGHALDIVDRNLGFSVLKHNIAEILESGKNCKTPDDIFAMAKTCREQIDNFIEDVETFGNPDKAKTLKELFALLKEEDLFTKFFSTIKHIAIKVKRTLRKSFKVDDEKSIIGAIARSLAGFGELLKAGLQIIWNATKFVVSFIAAGVIKIASWIVEAIMTFAKTLKGWSEKKETIIEKDDDEE